MNHARAIIVVTPYSHPGARDVLEHLGWVWRETWYADMLCVPNYVYGVRDALLRHRGDRPFAVLCSTIVYTHFFQHLRLGHDVDKVIWHGVCK